VFRSLFRASPLRSRKLAILTSVAILIISLIIGAYLRLQPVYNALRYGYGPTLYEMDPFSEYWIAKNLYINGLTYFSELRPENNVTKIFWYPWGRDFVTSALPALPYISVITYYVVHAITPSVSLYEWFVYLPVLFFILSTVGIYLTVYEVSNPLAAALAALTASLMFIDRHIAGFTVKYAVGLAFGFLAIYFHVRATKRNSFKAALIAGVLLGLTAVGWAGYYLIFAAIFIQYVLTPLIRDINGRYVILWLCESIPLAFSLLVTPFYGGYTYITHSVGIVIPAGTLIVLFAYLLTRVSRRYPVARRPLIVKKPRLTYFATLVIAGFLGIYGLYTGYIGVWGKGLAAMGLGFLTHTLVGTVAEYRSATPSEFMLWGGAPLIVTVIGIIYLLYRSLARGDVISLFTAALVTVSFIATSNVAYFFSYHNLVIALASSAIVGEILLRKFLSTSSRSWFVRMLTVFMISIYVTAIVLQGYFVWSGAYRGMVPTLIEAGTGLGMNIPSWINTLNWIRGNTSEDSVIVAWWDYGYWISVVGERPSVADGATLNVTQIELLAKALTGDERTAARIFTNEFRIPPDNLYVAVYEFFIVDDARRVIVPGPLVLTRPDGTPLFIGADGAKGIAAIYKIAGVDIDKEVNNGGGPHVKVFTYRNPQTGLSYSYVLPNWTSANVRNALLYMIMIDGVYMVWGPLGYEVLDIYANMGNPPRIEPVNMTLFKPSYIAVSRVTASVYLVVFLYKFSPEHVTS